MDEKSEYLRNRMLEVIAQDEREAREFEERREENARAYREYMAKIQKAEEEQQRLYLERLKAFAPKPKEKKVEVAHEWVEKPNKQVKQPTPKKKRKTWIEIAWDAYNKDKELGILNDKPTGLRVTGCNEPTGIGSVDFWGEYRVSKEIMNQIESREEDWKFTPVISVRDYINNYLRSRRKRESDKPRAYKPRGSRI